MPMQIDELKAELSRLTEQAKTLIEPFDEAQLAATPPEGGWSIAQCFAHLSTVGSSYTDRLKRAVDDAQQRGLSGGEPYRMGFIGRFVVKSQEPPVRWKIGAPKAFLPSDLTPLEAFARYLEMHIDLAEVMTRSEGLPLTRTKITSPRMRLNVFEAFHGTLAHERRHLWQAESIATALRNAAQSR